MHFSRIKINNFYNLKDVDLDLSSGSALIVGANGSGKTNIIKCVQKLVKVLSAPGYFLKSGKFFDRGIWNVDESSNGKPYIKVDAFLNKNEANLFKRLQTMFITFGVFDLVNNVIPCLRYKGFSNFSTLLDQLKQKCVEVVYQGLVKLDSSNERQQDHRSTLGVHFYAEHVESEVFRIDASFTEGMKFFGDADTKRNLVTDVLNSLFSANFEELIDFDIYCCGENMTPKNCISRLVDPFMLQGSNSSESASLSWFTSSTSVDNSLCTKLENEKKKYAEFFEAVQNLLDDLSKFGRDYKTWTDLERYDMNMALYDTIRGLLKDSLCILPQDRRSEDQVDQWILTLKEVERKLISWKSSENLTKRNQFKKVRETFRTLCGLDITTVEKKKENEFVTEHLQKTISLCQALIQKQDSHETAAELESCVDELFEVMPIGCRYMELVGEVSGDKCASLLPMSEWSGGERECLMVLVATQMSTADTVFLDEPGHSLHPPQQAQLRRFLEKETQKNIAIITHAVEFISATSLRSLYHMSATDLYFTPLKLTVEEENDDGAGGNGDSGGGVAAAGNADGAGGGDGSGGGGAAAGNADGAAGGDGSGGGAAFSSDGDGTAAGDGGSGDAGGGIGDDDDAAAPAAELEEEKKRDGKKNTTNRVLFKQKDLNLLMEPHLCKMFFSTGLYFVEGQSDKKVLSLLRQRMLKQAEKTREESVDVNELLHAVNILQMDSWDVLSLGGCGLAVRVYKAAKDLKIPCAFVLDEDSITVKCGSNVKPITKDNWEKSQLFRDLKGVKSSFCEASNLLDKIQEAFNKYTPEEIPRKLREQLQEFGFWVWEGDLESIIFDSNNVREKVKRMGEFIKLVLPNENRVLSGRSSLSQKDALQNYDKKIYNHLEQLLEELQGESLASRDALVNAEDPNSLPATTKLQNLLEEARKEFARLKQNAVQHDKFCSKGTTKSNGDDKTERAVSTKRTTRSVEDDKTADDNAFWKRIKENLHDRGAWMKIPEKMVVEIIEVCLQSGDGSDHQLAQFCEFMRRHQTMEMRKKEVPKEIVDRIVSMHLSRSTHFGNK